MLACVLGLDLDLSLDLIEIRTMIKTKIRIRIRIRTKIRIRKWICEAKIVLFYRTIAAEFFSSALFAV